MIESLDGYVIYTIERKKKTPYAVVCEGYESIAISKSIPRKLKDFVVVIEDKRFYNHRGIDFKGILRAVVRNLAANKIKEGGSTITQQLARNIIRDNSKTIRRKVRETLKAIHIENKFSKDEILDQYFNNAYFGRNLRGVRSASLSFFGKEPQHLTQCEIIYLLTLLRGPNYYLKDPCSADRRYRLLNKILLDNKKISRKQFIKAKSKKIELKQNALINFNNITARHIVSTIDTGTNSIISTLEPIVQKKIIDFVNISKYPVSVIAIREGKVIGFGSKYGSDYPYISKTNVGSTLKPFLYCFARQCGVNSQDKFDAYTNNQIGWQIREANLTKKQLTIDEALIWSNNNSFVNIADSVGMEKTLTFLSNLFNHPRENYFPSSILGATKGGISLYELAITYDKFFTAEPSRVKRECLQILNKIFTLKTGLQIDNVFLKTGTTNDNHERLAVLRSADTTFAILRNESPVDDQSKEGGFLSSIRRFALAMFKENRKQYKWR